MEVGQCKPFHRYDKVFSKLVAKLILKCEHTCVPVSAATVGCTTYYQIRSRARMHLRIYFLPRPPRTTRCWHSRITRLCLQWLNLSMLQSPSTVTIKDLAELLTLNKKDLLPDWKPAKCNGNPLQWHDWHFQLKSSVDEQVLTDDIKLTYLKTLVVGKAKDAIAEITNCGKM